MIDTLSPEQNKMVSSAYDRWLIFGLHLGRPYPIYWLYWWRLFNPLLNTSIAIMNRVGEIGSPCFMPLEDWNNPYVCPLMQTEYQLLERSLQTMSIITSPNPNFLKTIVRKIQDTLSYALVMSSFTTTLVCLYPQWK